MFFLIVGCGRVGSALARIYDTAGHQVTVIDDEEEAFSRLGNDFNGKVHRGVALEVDDLKRAGIEKADVCITATRGDNTNLVVAQIATEQFHVPCVVVRVFDPYRAKFYESKGLKTICPVSLAVDSMHETISEFRGEDRV